jgi:ZIP family zinc transporter
VHSFPEGLAIGTAYASSTAGLGLYVIVAIALQNVPEGTSVAIPMDASGFSHAQQFWAAVLTSAPQPVAAVLAYALVQEVSALLPVSFAFAAGAMLSLVALELLPQALSPPRRLAGLAGGAVGAALMVGFSVLLGV